MADSSLEDFFAKKDKSKKKTKTKAEVLSEGNSPRPRQQQPPGSARKEKKRDKDKQVVVNASGDVINVQSSSPQKEDEEWKDFEEAKEVDYSGLRIQRLNTSKDNQDRDRGEYDDSGICEDDNKEWRDGASGPWNQQNAPTAAAPAAAQALRSEGTSEEPAPKVPGKYIPPAQRQGAANSSSAAKFPTFRKNKEAPNVNSEEDFPTLGGGPGTGSKKWSSQQYSSAASSDLVDNANQRRGANLTLENKFSALQD